MRVKTTIFSIIAWILMFSVGSSAGLPRPLKPHEVKTLENNVRKDPKNKKSRAFLAEHYTSRKKWSDVIRVLAPYTETLDEPQLFQLSDAYIQMEDFREAEPLIKNFLNTKKMKPKRILQLVKLNNFLAEKAPSEDHKKQRIKESLNYLKTAQEMVPGHKKIYDLWLKTLEKFVVYYQYDALIVLDKMKKAGVEYRPRHHSLLCKYNYLANYLKQSILACKEATQVDENNPINWIYLGKSHIDNGDKDKGQRMLASVGKKYSHSEEALWATANMYHESKDLVSAYDFYKKASHHKDAKPRDFLGLALVAFSLKKYQEALDAFRTHCSTTKYLHHEFRRASGLLKDRPQWQKKYRSVMNGCNN